MDTRTRSTGLFAYRILILETSLHTGSLYHFKSIYTFDVCFRSHCRSTSTWLSSRLLIALDFKFAYLCASSSLVCFEILLAHQESFLESSFSSFRFLGLSCLFSGTFFDWVSLRTLFFLFSAYVISTIFLPFLGQITRLLLISFQVHDYSLSLRDFFLLFSGQLARSHLISFQVHDYKLKSPREFFLFSKLHNIGFLFF